MAPITNSSIPTRLTSTSTEVRTSSYLGEDDIVRIEDVYNGSESIPVTQRKRAFKVYLLSAKLSIACPLIPPSRQTSPPRPA